MLNLNLQTVLSTFFLALTMSACCCHCEDDDDGCPDLIVQEIVVLDVDCPGGFGTCVTTLTFTVANIGTADAGAFNVRIVLDPEASVVLNESVSGLSAGGSLNITVMSPPGGNCFDPDCTTTITADNNNAVPECNENNNQLSETIIG